MEVHSRSLDQPQKKNVSALSQKKRMYTFNVFIDVEKSTWTPMINFNPKIQLTFINALQMAEN